MSEQKESRAGEIVLSETRPLALRTTSLVERCLRDIARLEDIKQKEELWQNVRESEKECASLFQEWEAQWEALCEAVKSGNVELIKSMMKGESCLFIRAAAEEDVETVKLLLSCGADINARAAFDVTGLMEAAEAGHTEVVAMLVDYGADVNAKDSGGRTALHHVLDGPPLGCDDEAFANTKKALEVFANKQKQMPTTIINSIHIVNSLCRGGAIIDMRDDAGRRPLDIELETGRPEVLSAIQAIRKTMQQEGTLEFHNGITRMKMYATEAQGQRNLAELRASTLDIPSAPVTNMTQFEKLRNARQMDFGFRESP